MSVEISAGAGLFDDLIPRSPSAPSPPSEGGLFDDLIPAARPQEGEQVGADITPADHFVRQIGAGAAAAGASTLQAPAVLAGQVDSAAQRARHRTLEAMDRLDAVAAEGGRPGEVWSTLDSRDTTVLRDAARYWRALKAGDTDAAAALRRKIEGEAADVAPTLADPRETALYGAGEAVRGLYDEPGAPLYGNPDYKGDFWRDTVPSALGSTGAFLATGAAGAAARLPAALAAGATGAAVNSTDTFRDALESGADLETAYRAATGGAAVGAGEGLPIGQVLKRLDAVGGRRMRRIIAEGLKGMGEEAAQEALNAVGNNLIAAGLYDPERGVLEDAAESAAAGGTVGAIFSVVASTLAGGRRGGAAGPDTPRADMRDGDDGFAEAPTPAPPLPPGPKPEPGARVTVATPDGSVAGTVESVDQRGAMVRLDDTGDLEPVALRDIRSQQPPQRPAGPPPVEAVAAVNLNEGDLRSPIPNEIIGEGKAAMADAITAASAPMPAAPREPAGAPTGAAPPLFADLIPERQGEGNAGPPPLDLTEDMVVEEPPPLVLTDDMIVDTAPQRWRARQDQRDALVERARLEPGAYVDRDGVPYRVDPDGRVVRGARENAEAFGSVERGYVDDQGEAFARRVLAGEMRRGPGDQAFTVGARVAVAGEAGTVVSAGSGEIAVRLDGTGDIEPFSPGAVRPLSREPAGNPTPAGDATPGRREAPSSPPAPAPVAAPTETQGPAVAGTSLDRHDAVPIQDHLGGLNRVGAPPQALNAPGDPSSGGRASPPEDFVRAPNGTFDFGEIDAAVESAAGGRYPSGPIRMRRGTSETYGRDHIDAGKAERIQRAGFASVEDFVFDVAQNYDAVWEQKNGRLLLSKTGGGYDSTASIELERGRDGAYYAVITAMPVRQTKKYPQGGGRTLLWERRPAPPLASRDEAPSFVPAAGDSGPVQRPSGGKGQSNKASVGSNEGDRKAAPNSEGPSREQGAAAESRRPTTPPVVATLRGDEIGDFGDDATAWRRAADAWYRTHLQGRFVQTSDGRRVQLTGRGRKKTTHRLAPFTARHVPAIEAVLRQGAYGGFTPNRKPEQKPGVVGYHRYEGVVQVAEEATRVRVLVEEDAVGNLYYDLYTEAPSRDPGMKSPGREGAREDDASHAMVNGTDSGVNLIRLDAPARKPTAPARRVLQARADDLRARLKAVGLSDRVALRVVETLGGAVEGRTTPGLIEVALDADDPLATLDHEIVHALRETGVLRELDYGTLARRARTDRARLAEVRQRYQGRGLDEDALVEEAVADLFAAYARGDTRPDGAAARAIARVRGFFEAVGNWLRGLGFQTADDVFGRIDRGEMARQQPRDDRGRFVAGDSAAREARRPGGLRPRAWVRFTRLLDDLKAGTLGRFDLLEMGRTPEALRRAGLPDLTLVYKQGEARKTLLEKHAGKIDEETLRRLPDVLADPVLVVEQENRRFGVLIEDGRGQDVLTVIAPEVDMERRRVNLVVTTHPKARPDSILSDIRAGRLRYYHTQRGPEWVRRVRRQNAGGGTPQGLPTNIPTDADLVNDPAEKLSLRRGAPPPLPGFGQRPPPPPLKGQKPTARQTALLDKIGRTETGLAHWVRETVAGVKEASWQRVRQGLFDQFDAIATYERDAYGKLQDASKSAYKAARMTQNLRSVMGAVLKHGPLKIENGWFTLRDDFPGGFEGLFHDIARRGELDLFRGYMVARRARRLKEEGRERLLTDEDIEAGLYDHPTARADRFRKAFHGYQRFNRAVLDMAVDAGLLTREQRALWSQHGDYVPFYRIFDDGTVSAGPTNRRGLAGQRANTRGLEGGESRLNDPIENMVLNMTRLIDASMKNLAAQKTLRLAIDAGVVEPVPMTWKPVRVPPEEAARRLEDLGVQVSGLTKDQHAQMLTFFDMTPPKERDVISVMSKGRPKYLRINDPQLLAALSSMTPPQLNLAMRIMRFAKRTLTQSVTIMPNFMVANAMRDTLSAWVSTPTSKHLPVVDTVKGFRKALTDSPSLVAIMSSGGGSGGFYSADPTDVRDRLDADLRRMTGRKARHSPVTWWEAWQKVGQAAESANRIAVYDALRKDGVGETEAAYQALDLMDFSMRGDWAAVRFLAETVPFLNARLQGLYRLGRGAAAGWKRFVLRGALLMAPTLVLAIHNAGRPEYDELEDWDKDAYWHFWIGDQHFRLPKPFEVGAIFATIPERLVRLAAGQDDGTKAMERLGAMLTDTFAMNPIPQAFKPLVEQWGDRAFFTDRPIVGWQKTLPAEMQYTPHTTETAKLLGETLGASPKRIEHLVRGYTANLGMTALVYADVAVRLATDAPTEPASTWADMPVLGRFFRGDDVPRSTRYTTELYDLHREIETVVSGIRELEKQGLEGRADAMERENQDLLRDRRAVDGAVEALRGINREMRAVQYDRTLSAAEKRKRLDALMRERNAISREAVAD